MNAIRFEFHHCSCENMAHGSSIKWCSMYVVFCYLTVSDGCDFCASLFCVHVPVSMCMGVVRCDVERDGCQFTQHENGLSSVHRISSSEMCVM